MTDDLQFATQAPETPKEGRRALDFYPTPSWVTDVLLDELEAQGVNLTGKLLAEPCVGAGHIVRAVDRRYRARWITNDIDSQWEAGSHLDAGDASVYAWLDNRPAWIITNPPFNEANRIIPAAFEAATEGIAILLRLTWLEARPKRRHFLTKNAPYPRLLILPRASFTGDGKVDSVSAAWMIWPKRAIIVSPGVIPIAQYQTGQSSAAFEGGDDVDG